MPRVYTTLLKVTRIRLRIIAIDCASFTSVCVAVAEAILWRQHGSERIDPWRARRRWIRGSRGATADQHFSVLPLAVSSAREAESRLGSLIFAPMLRQAGASQLRSLRPASRRRLRLLRRRSCHPWSWSLSSGANSDGSETLSTSAPLAVPSAGLEGKSSSDDAPSSQDVGPSQHHDNAKSEEIVEEEEVVAEEEDVAAEAASRKHLEDMAAEPPTFSQGAENSAAAVQGVALAPQVSSADAPASDEQDECATTDDECATQIESQTW